ncbi:MAG: hypothetical protein AAF399_11945 [Bacteroidota bacterium]
MKLIPRLLLAVSALLVFGCNQGNIDLDNDGPDRLTVVIDELTYSLEARAYQKIQLEKGVHTITIKDDEGKELENSTFRVYEGGLLNLAKSNYLIWVDLYGDPSLRDRELEEDWITIGDKSFFGQFEQLDPGEIYIEKKWDYGLSDGFPDDLLGWQMTEERWIIKRKLFRQQGFMDAYNALVKE